MLLCRETRSCPSSSRGAKRVPSSWIEPTTPTSPPHGREHRPLIYSGPPALACRSSRSCSGKPSHCHASYAPSAENGACLHIGPDVGVSGLTVAIVDRLGLGGVRLDPVRV